MRGLYCYVLWESVLTGATQERSCGNERTMSVFNTTPFLTDGGERRGWGCCEWNIVKLKIPAAWLSLEVPWALQWRHNNHDSVSNHQPQGCLLNRLFRRRSMKTSKLRVTGLCVGNSPGPVNSPHKGPVTRKMFPFDDVIMDLVSYTEWRHPLH